MKKILVLIFLILSIFSIVSCKESNQERKLKSMKSFSNIVYGLVKDEEIKKSDAKVISSQKYLDRYFSYMEVNVAFEFEIEINHSITNYFEVEEGETLRLKAIAAYINLVAIIKRDDKSIISNDRFTTTLVLSDGDTHYSFAGGASGTEVGTGKDIMPDDIVVGTTSFFSDNQRVYFHNSGDKESVFLLTFEDNVITDFYITEWYDKSIDEIVRQDYTVDVIEDTYKRMDPKFAYDFINLTKVERVVFEATIIGYNENSIAVKSKVFPTLKTFTFNEVEDKMGNKINNHIFIEGQKVELTVFKRYPGYEPVNIHVSVVVLK